MSPFRDVSHGRDRFPYRLPSGASSDETAQEVVRLARDVLHGSAAAFYWVDKTLEFVAVEGLPARYTENYLAGYTDADPNYVRKMAARRQDVVLLGVADRHISLETASWDSFLDCYGIAELMELVFSADGEPVAGLSVMRSREDPSYSQDNFQAAVSLQRFIEFTIQGHVRLSRLRVGQRLQQLHFTQREIEITELAARGAKNKQIAQMLGVRLSTVKTHLLRVMDKGGWSSRTELAAAMADWRTKPPCTTSGNEAGRLTQNSNSD